MQLTHLAVAGVDPVSPRLFDVGGDKNALGRVQSNDGQAKICQE